MDVYTQHSNSVPTIYKPRKLQSVTVCTAVGYNMLPWMCMRVLCQSYNKLVITWASLMPHAWLLHGGDAEASGLRFLSTRANNLPVALEPMQ